MKQHLEIELDQTVDVWKLQTMLNTFKEVKCNVVTCNSIRVWFNDDKIADKKVMKLIQQFSNKDRRKRKANIIHIKEVNEAA